MNPLDHLTVKKVRIVALTEQGVEVTVPLDPTTFSIECHVEEGDETEYTTADGSILARMKSSPKLHIDGVVTDIDRSGEHYIEFRFLDPSGIFTESQLDNGRLEILPKVARTIRIEDEE